MLDATNYTPKWEDFSKIKELCVRYNIPVPEQVSSVLKTIPALSSREYVEFLSKYEKIRRFSSRFDCMALNGVITVDCTFLVNRLISILQPSEDGVVRCILKPLQVNDFIHQSLVFLVYSNPSKQVTNVVQRAFNQLIANTRVLHDYVDKQFVKWADHRNAIDEFLTDVAEHYNNGRPTCDLLKALKEDFTHQTAGEK